MEITNVNTPMVMLNDLPHKLRTIGERNCHAILSVCEATNGDTNKLSATVVQSNPYFLRLSRFGELRFQRRELYLTVLVYRSTTLREENGKRERGSNPQQVSYTVEQLVAVNPYNPDILPDPENYVNEQVSSQTYSLDANLCLLRLYQFEPESMSTQIVARILIKGLMAMPAPDFSLCLFLIPEQVQMEEQFKTLIVLSHYLETVRFHHFWDEAAKHRHIVEAVPGFEQAIHAYAIHVLSLTYQKVPMTVLAEAINMKGPSLDKFLEHQMTKCGWVLEGVQGTNQLIVLPQKEFNHPVLKKNTSDSIPLEHITRILPILG